MADDPEVIRQQMEETRSSLSEKLETLEQQVVETVQGATSAVAETVETVKEAVNETVTTVTGSVQDTVHSVKDTFDVPLQVERHPWTMLGLAVATGYVGGYLLERKPHDHYRSMQESQASRAPVYMAPQPSTPPAPEKLPQPSFLSKLADQFGPELTKLKGMAIGMGLSAVRDMVTNSAPPEMKEKLNEVLDGIISKLGGEPQAVAPSHAYHSTQEREQEQRFPSPIERPLTTSQRYR
ncbi:MAG: hypothetical protein K2R98_17075 [Gemmataceae bacterium]|nr:hypothetical protein [Gemmataceae bacterium]